MKKLTGWDKLYSMKKYQLDANGVQPDIPKRVLIKHGVWEEWVDFVMGFGCDDVETRKIFKEEYGCSEKEIDGYFAQYEQSAPLTMAAHA